MSRYQRTTRECALAELQPELAGAIRDYLQQQQLGHLETEIVLCCETRSERTPAHRLDAWLSGDLDTCATLALLLTPQRLIWARSGERSGTRVASAQLKDLRIKVFALRGTRDVGLHVYGRMDGTRDRAGGQMVLGPEAAAQKFCEEIGKAMEKLYPPKKQRPRLKWRGG